MTSFSKDGCKVLVFVLSLEAASTAVKPCCLAAANFSKILRKGSGGGISVREWSPVCYITDETQTNKNLKRR